MTARSFRIFTEPFGPGQGIWWWVRIYDDAGTMRRAAARYAPHHSRDYWNGVRGCCQGFGFAERFVDGRWSTVLPRNKLGGVIRLVSPFTYEEAGHELAHAALSTYRQAVNRGANFGDQCGDREENLCYLTGELIDQFFGQA